MNDLSEYDPIEDADVIQKFEDLRARWRLEEKPAIIPGGDGLIARVVILEDKHLSYEDWLEREFLNQNLAVDNLSDALNLIWGLMYPDDPTGWDYPGQVFNHIRIFIDEVRGERAATDQ